MSKFNADSTAYEVVEGHNLTGYNVVITGANSGIGTETARALAKAGATVFMTARNVEKAEDVRKDLVASTGNEKIHLEQLELDSLDNVNEFVQRYLTRKIPLHILINNAGIMACPLKHTKDGFESQLGTNHIGHFALTVGLLPCLKEAVSESKRNSRVITLSSCAHSMSDFDFDDPNFEKGGYHPWIAYGRSKTANHLFSLGLTHRYKQDGIFGNSIHPGFINTNLGRHDESKAFAGALTKYKAKTIPGGASTTVWASVAKELDGKGGLYLEDCSISVEKSQEECKKTQTGYRSYIMNLENARKLWTLSEKLIRRIK